MRIPTEAERLAAEYARNATRDKPVLPTRVNVIFHGLLAIRDLDADHYEALIPKTGDDNCHEASYGNPCLGDLIPFPVPGPYGPGPAFFSFEGILPEPPLRRSFPSATNTLIMKNSLLTPQYSQVRVVIKVPKPLIIRHYRGSETHLHPLAADDPTRTILQRNPDVLHEVTVFSYFAFFQPRLVGPGTSYPIPQPDPGSPALNIGIYSQPKTVCKDTDSQDFSAMFKVNPNLDLKVDLNSKLRRDDGPPLWTSIGISTCEFLAISELASPLRFFCRICGPHADREGFEAAMKFLRDEVILGAIPGGCGSGFACDDGV